LTRTIFYQSKVANDRVGGIVSQRIKGIRTDFESEDYNRRQHGAVGVTAQSLEQYACRIWASGSSNPA
jgi:hypothetical protein